MMAGYAVPVENRCDIAVKGGSLCPDTERQNERDNHGDTEAQSSPCLCVSVVFQKFTTAASRRMRPWRMLPGSLYVAPEAVLYDSVRTV